MKGLSIEEKAKAYDKLLVKLQEAKVDNNVCDERYCCVIDDIVPELKESEDERIKQRIIHALHGDVLEMSEIKEAITWLEKQGKPIDKIVKRAMNEKQRVLLTETNGDANIDWDTRSLQDVKLLLEYGLDYIKKLEKQGEKKHQYKSKPRYVGEGELLRTDKQGEKKPVEWSEEDEKMLKELITQLEALECSFALDFKVDKKWLKSLRPQNHWKPDIDELDALQDMLRYFRIESNAGNREQIADMVESLVEHLKAL